MWICYMRELVKNDELTKKMDKMWIRVDGEGNNIRVYIIAFL